jgi:hypothetical protein
MLFSKTGSLDATIGKRLKNEVLSLEAPTVWGSIASLTTMIHDNQSALHQTQGALNDIPGMTLASQVQLRQELIHIMNQRIGGDISDVINKINKCKGAMVATIQKVSSRFQQESHRMDAMNARMSMVEHTQTSNSSNVRSGVTASDVNDYIDAEIDVVRNMMGVMNRKIDAVIADNHQDAVKFNGFGFRRVEEAKAWVEANLPDHKFGLIVDVHMVFEHIHSSTAMTVTTLQQLAKIQMRDMSQGVAVSSFDQRIPKLLSDSSSYVVVKTEESYFNRIKTYKEWEEPYAGFRDRLKLDITEFELAHTLLVSDNTKPSSRLQACASLSCTYSLAWIEAFIGFIDETYLELTRAMFSASCGWSLITRLASRILL